MSKIIRIFSTVTQSVLLAQVYEGRIIPGSVCNVDGTPVPNPSGLANMEADELAKHTNLRTRDPDYTDIEAYENAQVV